MPRHFVCASTYQGFLTFIRTHGERESYDVKFVAAVVDLPAKASPGYRTLLVPGWELHPQSQRISAAIIERRLDPAYTELTHGKGNTGTDGETGGASAGERG